MNKAQMTRFFNNMKITVSKRSPEILTGIGIAGMITTTILAVKATPQALILIDNAKAEEDKDKLTPVETIKVTWKCYVPAAAICLASTACLIGASSVSSRRNAALATAYKLSETAYNEYRDKVVQTIGEKKEEAVKDAINKERVEKNPVTKNEVIMTGNGATLCYDHLSSRYFESDIDRIKRAENELNKQMLHDITGYVSLNDFYEEIGLDPTPLGRDLGWNAMKGLIDIHFGSQIADDGRPCIVIDHNVVPRYDYDKSY